MPLLICQVDKGIPVRQQITGSIWSVDYPYLNGDYLCDAQDVVYLINDGVLASTIDPLNVANEKWAKAYVKMNYPDFYCNKITLPTPVTATAKNYADLVVYNSNTGSFTKIPAETLAIFSGRCFKCIDTSVSDTKCSQWQPGNDQYWKLTDLKCTL